MIACKLPFSSQDQISLQDTTQSHLLEKTSVQFQLCKGAFESLTFYFTHTGGDFKDISYFALLPCIKKENMSKTNWLRHFPKCLPTGGQISLIFLWFSPHTVCHGYGQLMVQPKGDGACREPQHWGGWSGSIASLRTASGLQRGASCKIKRKKEAWKEGKEGSRQGKGNKFTFWGISMVFLFYIGMGFSLR